ncbi:hypothetical protein AWC38_SpisGene22304, partial [Stylophora pistillata]
MHPGEMDSILELSGENLDFDNRDEDNLEPESSSDKENHVGEEASRGNRHNTVAENILGGVTVRRKSEQKCSGYSVRMCFLIELSRLG